MLLKDIWLLNNIFLYYCIIYLAKRNLSKLIVGLILLVFIKALVKIPQNIVFLSIKFVLNGTEVNIELQLH